jgi:hypothetical protein
MFALVKAYLKAKLSWETPEEVSSYLHGQLEVGAQAKGEVMHSVFMRGIRGFSTWLTPLGVATQLQGNIHSHLLQCTFCYHLVSCV